MNSFALTPLIKVFEALRYRQLFIAVFLLNSLSRGGNLRRSYLALSETLNEVSGVQSSPLNEERAARPTGRPAAHCCTFFLPLLRPSLPPSALLSFAPPVVLHPLLRRHQNTAETNFGGRCASEESLPGKTAPRLPAPTRNRKLASRAKFASRWHHYCERRRREAEKFEIFPHSTDDATEEEGIIFSLSGTT